MSQPTFAIVVRFEIHPEHIEQFRDRVIQQAKDSVEKESGCHQFDVLDDRDDPHCIVLYETYRDGDAFVDHRNTDHFADFSQTVQPWVKGKTLFQLDVAHP